MPWAGGCLQVGEMSGFRLRRGRGPGEMIDNAFCLTHNRSQRGMFDNITCRSHNGKRCACDTLVAKSQGSMT